MNGTKLLAAAIAALVLIGGVAAISGAAPADVPTTDDDEIDAGNANVSENASVAEDRPGEVGPPDGLPEQVPDHVSEIHDTIESFLDGEIDRLGDALSDLL